MADEHDAELKCGKTFQGRYSDRPTLFFFVSAHAFTRAQAALVRQHSPVGKMGDVGWSLFLAFDDGLPSGGYHSGSTGRWV